MMKGITLALTILLIASASGEPASAGPWNENEVMIQVPPSKEIPGMTVLAVMPFKANIGAISMDVGDGAANKLISMLKDEPNSYKVVDRQNLGLTQDEMALVGQGIVDEHQAAEIGRARGAQGMAIGSLQNFVSPQVRTETRDRLVLGQRVGTTTKYFKEASLQVSIRLVRTEDASIEAIVEKTATRKWETENLSDIPNDSALILELLSEAAKEFISEVSIHNVKMRIKLHNDAGEDKVETIAIYLNTKRTEKALEKARESLTALEKADIRKHAAALYNVGVVLEAMGKCDGALEHYYKAVDLYIDGGRPKEVPDTYESAARRAQLCVDSKTKNQ